MKSNSKLLTTHRYESSQLILIVENRSDANYGKLTSTETSNHDSKILLLPKRKFSTSKNKYCMLSVFLTALVEHPNSHMNY